ncbi:hypothetical protein Hanom_Chr14g01335881 [Helianthus anomalus]
MTGGGRLRMNRSDNGLQPPYHYHGRIMLQQHYWLQTPFLAKPCSHSQIP